MKPSTIALGWICSFLFFLGISHLLDLILSATWLWKALGEATDDAGGFERTLGFEAMIMVLSATGSVLLTYRASKLLTEKLHTHLIRAWTLPKLALIWLILFGTYSIFFIATMFISDQLWHREIIINTYLFLNSSSWDRLHNVLSTTLPLLANAALLYLVLLFTTTSPRQMPRGH